MRGTRGWSGLAGMTMAMKKPCVVFLIIVFFASPLLAATTEVSFVAPDGFELKGAFYSTGKAAPGILLLHQCNADRQIYDNLGTILSAAGYNVLAFDFRGFGKSKGGEYTDFTAQRQKIMDRMPGDVEAALKFLISQNRVNSNALGIVGGSCGVNQAIQAARRHPEIRTLVLLSGDTDTEGEAFIKNASKIPILGVASEEDTTAAAGIKKIVGLSTNNFSQLQMLKDAGHAASMFAKQPDLETDIVIWFRSNMSIGGYGLPPTIK